MPEETIDPAPSTEHEPLLSEPVDIEPPCADGPDALPWLAEPWFYTPCEACR